MTPCDVVLCHPVRTAIGTYGGSLKELSAPDLGAVAIRETVRRAGLAPERIQTLVMGQVIQAGAHMNPARQAGIAAGLPVEVPALTVNRVCGSGAQAIASLAQEIWAGMSECGIAGGMENTSCTFEASDMLFDTSVENLRSLRWLDAHETAHQWFGDLVTCRDWSHLWLNEGFASYYTVLYEQEKLGLEAMKFSLWEEAESVFGANDTRPTVWRDYQDPMQQFDTRVYPKGAWILHMLRSQLGADLYRKAIRTYLVRHRNGIVGTDDLHDVIEEVSGLSFDQFFDQWLYHGGFPELKIDYAWDAATKQAKISVRQTQKVTEQVRLFRVPLPVAFTVKGQKEPLRFTMDVHEAAGDFYFALPAQPTLDQIIATVHDNTQRVRSYMAPQAVLIVPGVPRLSAQVACEPPRRFRLRAQTAVTGSELDIVRGDHDGGSPLCDRLDQVGQPVLQAPVHSPGRLVEGDEVGQGIALGPAGEGDRQGEPLSLATREVTRVDRGVDLESDRIECRPTSGTFELGSDRLPDEVVAGVLGQERHSAAGYDLPGHRGNEAGSGPEQGRLPGTVPSHQGNLLPGLDREIDPP
jgi:limonene-1,2-epoxide hydrolase